MIILIKSKILNFIFFWNFFECSHQSKYWFLASRKTGIDLLKRAMKQRRNSSNRHGQPAETVLGLERVQRRKGGRRESERRQTTRGNKTRRGSLQEMMNLVFFRLYIKIMNWFLELALWYLVFDTLFVGVLLGMWYFCFHLIRWKFEMPNEPIFG